ncbi:hypothetical protein ABT56_11985 [Photobacterium aquae]|uniref:Uncharacterized protein n=1 Tax=Photobacterium aquae TaxID=1195763 RepID=A0A0J1JT29_9GAMM|nr:hypothetical protein [Photobacterium aquae]KLV05427.1 hypothetical protein ABT56_11985 [Photobacterium aquae]
MGNGDIDGIKRDLSGKVSDIFDAFEDDNSCLPTIEEFRTLFNCHAESYIGPMDQLSVEGGKSNLDRALEREQKMWLAVSELEAEQRESRS